LQIYEYLGNIKSKLSQTLAPASCKVLAVRPRKVYPQVISTSRHITQGLMDVKEESWNPDKRTLSGTSAVVKGEPLLLSRSRKKEFMEALTNYWGEVVK